MNKIPVSETSPFIDAKSLLEDLSDDCYETESEPESESDLSVYDSDEYPDDTFNKNNLRNGLH